MKKLVSNQLSPNFTILRAWQAFCTIRFLYAKQNLDFSREFETKNYVLCNAARTALGEIAKLLPQDKKVAIPAVCCAVMATPFLSQGIAIEWIDCDENGLIDLDDLTAKSRDISAVIVPHTFGLQVDMQKVYKITKSREIFIIEDGAHSFGPISPYADAKILSFGREKDVSSVSGGALLWNDNCTYAENFAGINLSKPSKIWTLRHLFQPLILALSLSFWFYGGRFIAGIWSKLGFFPRAVTPREKNGTEDFPSTKMPRAIQEILKESLKKRKKDLAHRQKIAEKWQSVVPKLFPTANVIIPQNYFRVIMTNVERKKIKANAKKRRFDLNEWDGEPISPVGVNLARFGYQKGDCPQSEKFMQHYITLPTNVRTSEDDVEDFLKEY